eukprot:3946386-Amphidinium_carterae.2
MDAMPPWCCHIITQDLPYTGKRKRTESKGIFFKSGILIIMGNLFWGKFLFCTIPLRAFLRSDDSLIVHLARGGRKTTLMDI